MEKELLEEIREARKKYESIEVECPHLDENLRPVPQLISDYVCPAGRDGKCASCDLFRGFWSEDGYIAAYKLFEGFCDCKK